MKASDYGLKNLRRVVKGLPEWIYEEGNLGDNLAEGYKAVFGQYRRYVGHVLAQIWRCAPRIQRVWNRAGLFSKR